MTASAIGEMGFCVSTERRRNPQTAGLLSKSAALDPAVLLSSTVHLDIQQHYRFIKVLGHGQFGTVREAVFLGHERRVAIKSVSKAKVKGDIVLLKRELEVMRMIDHPNLIKYYSAFEDGKYLHIVMELCSGGDLLEKLSSEGFINEGQVRIIMRKLMLAVHHLHQVTICHRDLKPDNFLFVSKVAGAEIKIIDFGMSIKQPDLQQMNSFVGTPYYLAPEVIAGNYGLECDIWSLGVVMFVLLSGQQPFGGETLSEIMQRISHADYDFDTDTWDPVSIEAKDLVTKMLVVRPAKRISLPSALGHAWFSGAAAPPLSRNVLSSLQQYKAPKKLQQEVMKIMIKFLSAEEIEEMKYAFIEMDRAHSGFVTPADIEIAMTSAGMDVPSEEVKSKK